MPSAGAMPSKAPCFALHLLLAKEVACRVLAWVLAALAFCALSAAFVMVRLARLVDNTKSLVKECNLIDISLVGTEYFG